MTTQEKIRAAQQRLLNAAQMLAGDAGNDELWRDVCSARATLRAYARCGA